MASAKSISVVGLGYVGLPLALLAEEKGYQVSGITKTKKSADELTHKKTSIVDRFVVSKLKKSHLVVSTNFSSISASQVVVICVPTPVTKTHMPDLTPLISACKQIGRNISTNQLIILESTVNPGVSEEIVIPLLEKESGLKVGQDFYFAFCPERINPGDNKWTIENIPRVLGASDPKSLRLSYLFYTSILSAPIKKMRSIKEAEAVKIVENSFRDVNIAFVNELAKSFALLEIDIMHVLDGADTKPFSFLRHNPGIGVGGHCIPVDPYYLIRSMKKRGFSHEFLKMARKINNSMASYAVEMLSKTFKEDGLSLKGQQVGVLGISYKPNIADTRESPSYKVTEELKKKGAQVSTYDPFVPNESTEKTLELLLKKSTAVILVTAHKQFLSITPSLLRKHNVRILIDGRNALNKELFNEGGVLYKGIGR